MSKHGFAMLAAAMISLAGASASAAWNPAKSVAGWFKSEKQNALLVTGNYLRPKRLAELAQELGGQKILVFARDGRVYLVEDEKVTDAVAKADAAALVAKLAPAKVIVLGGAQYVPQECVESLGVAAPVILADSDWAKNGAALAGMLGEKKLKTAYEKCLSDIDEVLQRAPAHFRAPVAVPVEPQTSPAVAAPVVPAEPVVAPAPAAPGEKKAEPAAVLSPIEPIIHT